MSLSLVPEYAARFQPRGAKFPAIFKLSRLFNHTLVGQSREVVQEYCDTLDVSVSQAEADMIEESTRLQAGCPMTSTMLQPWKEHRQGRTTGTKAKAVANCDLLNPSDYLIKSICYSDFGNFTGNTDKIISKSKLFFYERLLPELVATTETFKGKRILHSSSSVSQSHSSSFDDLSTSLNPDDELTFEVDGEGAPSSSGLDSVIQVNQDATVSIGIHSHDDPIDPSVRSRPMYFTCDCQTILPPSFKLVNCSGPHCLFKMFHESC